MVTTCQFYYYGLYPSCSYCCYYSHAAISRPVNNGGIINISRTDSLMRDKDYSRLLTSCSHSRWPFCQYRGDVCSSRQSLSCFCCLPELSLQITCYSNSSLRWVGTGTIEYFFPTVTEPVMLIVRLQNNIPLITWPQINTRKISV